MAENLSRIMHVPRLERISDEPCVTLIGIAGAGKSTLGTILAERLGWAMADTDRLLEAYYARPLQQILDESGLEGFKRMEEHLVSTIMVTRTIIATGGSVIYSDPAVNHLKSLGPMVHLDISPETFMQRVGDGRGRGLIIGGKTYQDLYDERRPLYEGAADFTVHTDERSPRACADQVLAWLAQQNIPASPPHKHIKRP